MAQTSTPPPLHYARRALAHLHRMSREASAMLGWAIEFQCALGLTLPADIEGRWERMPTGRPPAVALWRVLITAVGNLAPVEWPQDMLARLAGRLGLDAADLLIMRLLLDRDACEAVSALWDRLVRPGRGRGAFLAQTEVIALLTGLKPADVLRRLAPDGSLRTSALVRVDLDHEHDITVLDRLRRLMLESSADDTAALLGPPVPANLTLAQFRHLGTDIDRVLALLRGALAGRVPGIHVLLYGPPGTGKTELAKTIAAALNVKLYLVGEAQDDGSEPTRQDRLDELVLAQRLLGAAEPTMLLFDEAEDLFDAGTARGATGGSRAYVHRLLERGTAPVIWTANGLDSFSPAVLRRMACCLEVRVPPAATRATLWAQAAVDEGVVLPAHEIDRLARWLPASPGVARSAMRAARIAGGDVQTVRWAITGVAKAMNGGPVPACTKDDITYDPALITADVDLQSLAARLMAANAPRGVSMLLSGPPGSGKSAFARDLAAKMGLEVMHKRGSDLLGRYVGETEHRIARAFQDAADAEAFLIFDEADGLLADRRAASHNWEVTQVNEMLTWMESHRLPFCCTTNLVDRIDPAAMRRFVVKARFGFLSPGQASIAFQRYFNQTAPSDLGALDGLTPADFDLVRRAAALQGFIESPAALVQALAREQADRPDAGRSIGFRSGK